jgi:iron complex transport system ATP-binding protein
MPQHDRETASGLSLSRLALGYGSKMIVEGLDLAIPAHAFTVLLGRNGSGKSTVLRACAGLLRPKAGAVLLDGTPLARIATRERARRIAILPQGPVTPEGLTVLDLVRQGRYPHRGLFARWSNVDEEACEEALDCGNSRSKTCRVARGSVPGSPCRLRSRRISFFSTNRPHSSISPTKRRS